MSKTKRVLLLIAYFLMLFFIIRINSSLIVEWLNKSMFIDYDMDAAQNLILKESFANGVSLIFTITVFLYSIFGTTIISILITDILMFGLIFANQMKVVERNEFITFSELKTVASPKELLSFVNVSPGFAILVVILALLFFVGLQILILKTSKK